MFVRALLLGSRPRSRVPWAARQEPATAPPPPLGERREGEGHCPSRATFPPQIRVGGLYVRGEQPNRQTAQGARSAVGSAP